MYVYTTENFFHINHYLKSVSKVALLHRLHFILMIKTNVDQMQDYYTCMYHWGEITLQLAICLETARWVHYEIDPLKTPLLYNKTGVDRGIHYIFLFLPKT